jgi:hypothetical protein
MNQQQPDNFFREKLYTYQKPAPADAWKKIESTLEKKTERTFPWWKAAASLLLIAGAAYLLWFSNRSTDQQPVASTESRTTEAPERIKQVIPDSPIEKKSEFAAKDSAPKTSVKKVLEKPRHHEKKAQIATTAEQPRKAMTSQEEASGEQLRLPQADSQPVEQTVNRAARSTITLTFSSAETNQYLNKNALAEATSDDKKPSTLKKFLKKANDLKSNQDPFGDLRERKNEILALNFKTDKREQNK